MKKFLLGLVGIVCALFTISAHALPAGYTELEYIESTGTQYINTLLPVKSNTLPKVIYQQTSCSGTGAVFGQVGGSIANLLAYRTHSSDNVFWFARLNPVACDTSKHTVVFNSDGKLYKDSTAIGTRGEFGSGSSLPMLLFAISSDNNTIKYGTVKIFSFKVKEGDTLVANLVPAKYGDTIGMYDTVSGTFFENSGTGSFVAGPEACEGERVAYTSATGTVSQNGTPTPTNPIYPTFYTQGNMVLRKVGDYADTYDATTGKITRKVGVKVLDGTENWSSSSTRRGSFYITNNTINALNGAQNAYCSHLVYVNTSTSYDSQGKCFIDNTMNLWVEQGQTLTQFKQYLAEQYAAGTPVTIWYPLATEVVEDWPSSYCQQAIKVASTKYVETEFSALNTALANAVATVNTVVTQTIAQAASIATLQSGKQTRPADNTECPAYKQCLLVEDEQGVPHWYQITDPFRDFVAPIIANNVAPASTTNQPGYTQLEYIESTGTQYIDTGVTSYKNTGVLKTKVQPAQTDSGIFLTYQNPNEGYDQIGLYLSSYSWFYQYGNQPRLRFSASVNIDYEIEATNGSIKINGVERTGTPATEFTINSNMYIGAATFASNGAIDTRIFKGKIYYFHYEDKDGNVLFNGIPCRRNSDSVLGMYDTVTKTFYTNAGTGAFTAGPTVANTDVPTNPTWSATWTANASNGVAAGTITGEGLCNGVAGTVNTAATSAQMSSANWSVDGANCWCRATGVDDGNESSDVDGVWVFAYTFSSAADCANACAYRCAYRFRDNASFRSTVFGM